MKISQTYFRSVIESVSKGVVDESEGSNKIMTLVLLTCYNSISMYTALEVFNRLIPIFINRSTKNTKISEQFLR